MRVQFVILFIASCSFIQDLKAQSDQLFILKKEKLFEELNTYTSSQSAKKKKGLGNALLTVYQKHISILISADCLYSLSCSRYSREAINKYGIIKGVLLTADRLNRCSFASSKDIPQSKFNEDGLAEDNP